MPQGLVRGPKNPVEGMKRFPKRFPKITKPLSYFLVPQMPLKTLPHALQHSLKCSPLGALALRIALVTGGARVSV
jgi:hypothetical protein